MTRPHGDTMRLAERLWHDNLDLARACLDDPFVAGLASGETPRDRFAWYVGQDAAFLEVFARAYALALARSPDRVRAHVPTAGSCSHSPSCCAA